MPAEQKEIYYLTGPNRRAIEGGPHLEAMRKQGYDVLLLVDPVDEWVVESLPEFDKRKLKSVAHGDIDLGEQADGQDAAGVATALTAVKGALGERVKDVRASKRLTESASCLVAAEGDPGMNMERIMKALEAGAKEIPGFWSSIRSTHCSEPGSACRQDPASPRIGSGPESCWIRRSSRKESSRTRWHS